jgi:hypothetical protein
MGLKSGSFDSVRVGSESRCAENILCYRQGAEMVPFTATGKYFYGRSDIGILRQMP